MADFGKLNFSVAFNPTTAFPLDARYYFATLAEAQAAAAAAVEVGSSDGTYFFGESICVVADGVASLYIIQPNKTLKPVGTEVLGDDKSIEIKDGKVTVKGFDAATAGQQPRINAAWPMPLSGTRQILAPFLVLLIRLLVIRLTLAIFRTARLIRPPRLRVMVSRMR